MTEETQKNQTGRYGDIIDLPHHVSRKHAAMSVLDRAAQFAPFQALTGYDEAVEEEGRLTEAWKELDENAREELDRRLNQMMHQAQNGEETRLRVTWFEPDALKDGGAYKEAEGEFRKLDPTAGKLILADGRRISLKWISGLELL